MAYYGSAHPFKVYQGEKSVSLRIKKQEAYLLAEAILRAANKNAEVNLAIYPARSKRAQSRISVLGK
jgi:hypothetical protein